MRAEYPKKMNKVCHDCGNRAAIMVHNWREARDRYYCPTCRESRAKKELEISKPALPKTELEIFIWKKPERRNREEEEKEYLLALRKQKGLR